MKLCKFPLRTFKPSLCCAVINSSPEICTKDTLFMKRSLQGASVTFFVVSIWAICWPHLWFDWSGMARPAYLDLWRTFGMALSVFGLGFLLASINPAQLWPIVLMGLIVHVSAPAGFFWACYRGAMKWEASWLLLLANVVWIPVFLRILWKVGSGYLAVIPEQVLTLKQAGDQFRVSEEETLREASERQPLAIVFLRHFGCTFTQLMLKRLQESQRIAAEKGAKLVLIHMLEAERAKVYLKQHEEVARIADPKCELYQAFGLGKGDFWDLFGPRVWLVGVYALFKGCGVGRLAGDGLQMPGAFLYYKGEILTKKVAKDAGDLPDPARVLDEV